ncbi:hypothetical protein TYRP_022954 [Tyrophagus putrescentiae]|nr:hypothetical protein TYRP_022954 [Tyrophagus putrescentiae]
MKNRFDRGERKKGDRNDKQSSGSKSGAELKLRFDLGTLKRTSHWEVGPSNRGPGGRQVALAFAQHGATVYCMNALAVQTRDSNNSGHNLKVVNNQLWALDSSSLALRQVNDGPAGDQIFGPASASASALPLTPPFGTSLWPSSQPAGATASCGRSQQRWAKTLARCSPPLFPERQPFADCTVHRWAQLG